MASRKSQPKTDNNELEIDIQAEIMNPESQFTDEQLADMLHRRMTEKQIQERQKPVQREKIEDFMDERVKVFDKNAIYSVYNRESGTEMLYSGNTVKFFFGMDKKTKENFIHKKLGSRVEVGVYRILFKYFVHLSR